KKRAHVVTKIGKSAA
ncbi:hypothetical protein MTO96_043277, partial [Rhipicephalus appendiculatus]